MKKHYAWVIAFTGTFVLLLSHGFGKMSYSVILPSMREGLDLSYTQVGLIGTGNFIGYLCLAVIGGFLAARFGARKLIFISLMVMSISLFLTGLSNSFATAFLMRLITGLGNGGSYVPIDGASCSMVCGKKEGACHGHQHHRDGSGVLYFRAGSALFHTSIRRNWMEVCLVPDGGIHLHGSIRLS